MARLFSPSLSTEPRAKQPKLSFEHVGDKYFLSEVDTPGGIYTFAFTAGDGCAGADEDQGTMSSGGTN